MQGPQGFAALILVTTLLVSQDPERPGQVPQAVPARGKGHVKVHLYVPGRGEAEARIQRFTDRFEKEYPRAVESLRRTQEQLLTFYDFPSILEKP